MNAQNTLPALLSSLRQQTDKSFECVVIDGGSSDDTVEMIRSARDIVTYSVSERDGGIYDAINKGVRACGANHYVVVGADDTLMPDAIARFRQAAIVTGADIVVADVAIGDTIKRGFHRQRAWLGHPAMITSHSVGTLIRRSLHDRFGFYSLAYPLLADGLFLKRAFASADVVVKAANFLAGRFAPSGQSNLNLDKALCELWQIQLATGENPLLQYLLFQGRLIKNLPAFLKKHSGGA